jgi:hypothetical protein
MPIIESRKFADVNFYFAAETVITGSQNAAVARNYLTA